MPRTGVARARESARRALSVVAHFRFTLLLACIVTLVAWLDADRLLWLWFPDALASGQRATRPDLGLGAPAAVFVARVRVVALSAGAVVFPLFAAEAWLLLCSLLHDRRARRFALPFALATALVVLATIFGTRVLSVHASRFLLAFT